MSDTLGHDVRAAAAAEAAELAGGGFDRSQVLLAAQPLEFFARHCCDRREGRAVGFAAGLAMAVHDALDDGVGLVGDGAAKAASGQHGGSPNVRRMEVGCTAWGSSSIYEEFHFSRRTNF